VKTWWLGDLLHAAGMNAIRAYQQAFDLVTKFATNGFQVCPP